jgi:hypothetical protein
MQTKWGKEIESTDRRNGGMVQHTAAEEVEEDFGCV